MATAPAKAFYPRPHDRRGDPGGAARGGNCSRQVHNFGTPAAARGGPLHRLRGPHPGRNWSSYPPHKHDEEKDGETSLEEIYYFETRVAAGAQRPGPPTPSATSVSTPPMSGPSTLGRGQTGDVVLVPYGWHGPAMAAPGYDAYHLNVMAGPGPVRDWLISDDPHHGWIRQTWEGQDIDQRLLPGRQGPLLSRPARLRLFSRKDGSFAVRSGCCSGCFGCSRPAASAVSASSPLPVYRNRSFRTSADCPASFFAAAAANAITARPSRVIPAPAQIGEV